MTKKIHGRKRSRAGLSENRHEEQTRASKEREESDGVHLLKAAIARVM